MEIQTNNKNGDNLVNLRKIRIPTFIHALQENNLKEIFEISEFQIGWWNGFSYNFNQKQQRSSITAVINKQLKGTNDWNYHQNMRIVAYINMAMLYKYNAILPRTELNIEWSVKMFWFYLQNNKISVSINRLKTSS